MKKTIVVIALALLVVPAISLALSEEEEVNDKNQPLKVTSDSMKSDKKKQLISFFGNVIAIKGGLRVEANKMFVYTNEDQSDFDEIEAIGNVKIVRGEKIATGQRAHYYSAKQQIVITGSPKLIQGNDVATGEKVIYYFDQEDMEIYGSKERRSTLILFPKGNENGHVKQTQKKDRQGVTFGAGPQDKGKPASEEATAPAKERASNTGARMEDSERSKPEITGKEEASDDIETEVVVDNSLHPVSRPKPVKPDVGGQSDDKPAKTASPPKLDPNKPVLYAVQVGSYKSLSEAIMLKKSLVKKGYQAYVRRFSEAGTDWYRVRVGGYKTKSSVARTEKKLKEIEHLPTYIIPYQP